MEWLVTEYGTVSSQVVCCWFLYVLVKRSMGFVFPPKNTKRLLFTVFSLLWETDTTATNDIFEFQHCYLQCLCVLGGRNICNVFACGRKQRQKASPFATFSLKWSPVTQCNIDIHNSDLFFAFCDAKLPSLRNLQTHGERLEFLQTQNTESHQITTKL